MSGCKPSSRTGGTAAAVKESPFAKNFSGPVVVDPITRIEGHYRVEVEVTNGKVSNVWTKAQLFRGLEIILKGRDPRDAQHFTQRSCGVCTFVHTIASVRCVDNAVKVKIPENATLLRNLVLAQQFLHDHIVHFYHLHALDWVDVTSALQADPAKAAKIANDISPRKTDAAALKAVQDKLKSFVESGQLGIFTNAYFLGGHPAYYLPPEVNLIATAHYLEALRLQVKAARGMAVFGAKNPHPQFTVVGGVTSYESLTPERIAEFTALWKETKDFIDQVYIPDLLAVASYYKDWAGHGGTTNFMTFGEFPTDEYDLGSRFIPAGVIKNRDLSKVLPFEHEKIAEHVAHSWYKGNEALHPWKGKTEPQYTSLTDKERYSWFKAPRYDGLATEVGPLAHCLVSYAKGVPEFKKAVDGVLKHLNVPATALFSTLGRTAARGIECQIIAAKMEGWIQQLADNVKAGKNTIYTEWEFPKGEAYGVGFADVPRGALSHWIKMKDGKIDNFQLVVPSTWNLCPKCGNNVPSPIEEALMGHPIADPKRPVEILRTVHSYDPCIACGVHVIDPKSNEVHKFRIL